MIAMGEILFRGVEGIRTVSAPQREAGKPEASSDGLDQQNGAGARRVLGIPGMVAGRRGLDIASKS